MTVQQGATAQTSPAHAHTLADVEGVARRLALTVVPLWLLPVLAASLSPSSSWGPAAVLPGLGLTVLGYLLFWRVRQPGLLVGGLFAAVFWLASHDPAVRGIATQDLMLEQWVNLAAWTTGVIVARSWRSTCTIIAGIATTAALLLVSLTRASVSIDGEGVLALVAYGLTDGFAAVAAFAVLRRSAIAADARIERRLRTAEALASQRARQHELRRISRLMHDTVVNTLCAVQLWPHTDAHLLRSRAAADLELLESLQPAAGTAPRAVTAACRQRASLLGLDLACADADDVPDLPAEVAAAIQGACWEALTNTAKHSGTHFASMSWELRGDAVCVEIRDHGVGFAPRILATGGVAESVFARCAEVGVEAALESSPGDGTVMRLQWNPHRREPVTALDAGVPIESSLATAVGWIAAALGMFSLGALLRVGLGPLQSWWGVAAFTVVIGVVSATYRAYRGNGVMRPVAVAYVLAGLVVVALPSLGVHGCARVGTWWWGPFGGILLGAYAAVLDARRSAVVATLIGTALGYVTAVTTLVDGTEKCRQDTLAFLVLQCGIIVGLGGARRLHAALNATSNRALHDAAEDRMLLAREAATQRARQRHTTFARTIAGPVLSGLADGTLDISDAEVRISASRVEDSLRLLAAVDAIDDAATGTELADMVVAAHNAGVRLHLSFATDAMPGADTKGELQAALRALLAVCTAGCTAQLTLLAGNRMVAVVSPAPDQSAHDRLRAAGWIVTVADGQLVLECTLGES